MVAAALARADTSALAFYSDERTADPALCALRDKVEVELVADDWPAMQAEVVVHTKDGRVSRARHNAGLPLSDVGRQRTRLVAKFERLVDPVLGHERRESLLSMLRRLEEVSAHDLMAACAADH
jgi:2-methylcitrate dehydratase PrpD